MSIGDIPEDFDFDVLTEADLDQALTELVSEIGAEGVLSYGDVYSILREELYNDMLDLAAQKYLEQ